MQQNHSPHCGQKKTSLSRRPHSWQRLTVDIKAPMKGSMRPTTFTYTKITCKHRADSLTGLTRVIKTEKWFRQQNQKHSHRDQERDCSPGQRPYPLHASDHDRDRIDIQHAIWGFSCEERKHFPCYLRYELDNGSRTRSPRKRAGELHTKLELMSSDD
jgi:hypothetical protein